MSHSLQRFAYSEVFNTPQFIEKVSFQPITSYLISRLDNIDFSVLKDKDKDREGNEDNRYSVVNNVAIVPIEGTLTYKPQFMWCSASTSYVELVEDIEEIAESGIKTILFEVNSGGGAASHMMETSNRIREILDENSIKSVAYVDTMMASAALGLGIIADEVIANPSASVGSVGAVIALMDSSEAMKKDGYKQIFIASGKQKVPFEEDGSFREGFISKLQQEVNDLGMEFCEHVSKYTGIPTNEIVDLEAALLTSKEAKEFGFVNKVMTVKEFCDYFSSNYIRKW